MDFVRLANAKAKAGQGIKMDVDEFITVVPYTPQWSQLFSHEQQRLQSVSARVARFHHDDIE